MVENKNVWVGTQNGLNRIQLNKPTKTATVNQYLYDAVHETGYDITAIFKDSFNNLWVGTRQHGLLKKSSNEDFVEVALETAEPISTVFAIIENKPGDIWLSTNKGLVNIDTDERVKTYNPTNFASNTEYRNGSVFKSKRGDLLFGGLHGVLTFKPDELKDNSYVPKVVLTDFYIKNELVTPNAHPKILNASISSTNKVVLKHDQANFSISYALPNYINGSNNKYRYRLEGLEEEWTETNKTQVNYTIQNPGDYVFEVYGANNDGYWNKTPAQLVLTVKPIFGEAIWHF